MRKSSAPKQIYFKTFCNIFCRNQLFWTSNQFLGGLTYFNEKLKGDKSPWNKFSQNVHVFGPRPIPGHQPDTASLSYPENFVTDRLNHHTTSRIYWYENMKCIGLQPTQLKSSWFGSNSQLYLDSDPYMSFWNNTRTVSCWNKFYRSLGRAI